jgi:hypothetical protein
LDKTPLIPGLVNQLATVLKIHGKQQHGVPFPLHIYQMIVVVVSGEHKDHAAVGNCHGNTLAVPAHDRQRRSFQTITLSNITNAKGIE